MDIRQELYKLRKEYIDLEAQADRCKELHALAYSGGGALRYDKERVQTSAANNTMNAVEKLVVEEQKMLKMLVAHKEHRAIVNRIISVLPEDEYYIIHEHFFNLKTYSEINPSKPYKKTKQRAHNIIRKLQLKL